MKKATLGNFGEGLHPLELITKMSWLSYYTGLHTPVPSWSSGSGEGSEVEMGWTSRNHLEDLSSLDRDQPCPCMENTSLVWIHGTRTMG